MFYKIVKDFIVDLYLIYNDCHNNIPMGIKGNHENTIFKRYQFFKIFFVFSTFRAFVIKVFFHSGNSGLGLQLKHGLCLQF